VGVWYLQLEAGEREGERQRARESKRAREQERKREGQRESIFVLKKFAVLQQRWH